MLFRFNSVLIALCYCLLFSINYLADCRTVPDKDDICTRYPQFLLCVGNRPNGGNGAGQVSPPPPVDKQPLDRDTYCKQYQLHYTYFCSPGIPTDDKAKDFCQAYGRNCDVNQAPQAYSKEQITAECNKRRSLAETYCTGAAEPPSIKTQCDQYRQYCVKGQQQQPPPLKSTATSAPQINADAQYCSSNQRQFAATCGINRSGRKRRQNDPMAVAAANGFSPEKVNQLCAQYGHLGEQYCTGHEAKSIREKCNLYRTYCLNRDQGAASQPQQPQPQPQPQPKPQPQPQPQPTAFCQDYTRRCTSHNPPPAAVQPQPPPQQNICANNAFMADKYCPGYETVEKRQACNNYRVQCQNKPAFREINGGTVNFNNGGIANIPNTFGNQLITG